MKLNEVKQCPWFAGGILLFMLLFATGISYIFAGYRGDHMEFFFVSLQDVHKFVTYMKILLVLILQFVA